MLCERFARNRLGDQATVSVRHGNSACPPTSPTFCNVRLAGEPNAQVTVRDASGFVTTIGESARAKGTAVRTSLKTKAPKDSRDPEGPAFSLGLRGSIGVSRGAPSARPRPNTAILHQTTVRER